MQYIKNTRMPYYTWSHFAVYKPASCFFFLAILTRNPLRSGRYITYFTVCQANTTICQLTHRIADCTLTSTSWRFSRSRKKLLGERQEVVVFWLLGCSHGGPHQIAADIKHRLTRKVKIIHCWIFQQDEDLKRTSQSTQKYFQRQQNKGSAMAITVPRHKRHRKPAG